MAVAEFHLDTRIRRYHVPLATQQHRLRHLRSLAARNIIFSNHSSNSEVGLYFSLHHKPCSPSFYTSEVIFDCLNPTWKDFETCNFPEVVNTASPYLTVKLWKSSEENRLLIEWVVFFSGLCFLGEQVPKEGKNFKPNTVIFGMMEGYYGSRHCHQHSILEIEESSVKESIAADSTILRTSYTLSTLCRIKTIERAIKQTQAAAHRRRKSIESKLQGAEELHVVHAQRELLRIKISMLQLEVQNQQYNLQALQKETTYSQEKNADKWSELRDKYEELRKQKEKLTDMWRCFCEFRESLLKTDAQLTFRKKELISDLSWIYPIVEFPDRKGFSIHNVHLPNSEDFSGHDETMISIALGYVCHILLMISQFLNVPLRYSIHFCGSRSTIIDHISSTIPVKSREFPLYAKGKDKRLFAYGVYLLNKNIAQLRLLYGLMTRELSATLPNLNSLLELRLSVNSDPYAALHSPNPALSQNASAEPAKYSLLSETLPQNGLTHHSTGTATNAQAFSTEIEFLKKEMEAMMPNAIKPSENNGVSNCKTVDISNTLSCSLDKGLNDIKELEKSYVTKKSENKQKPEKLSTHFKLLGQGYHHSSYPNLNSSLRTVEPGSLVLSSNNSPLQSTPLKMWVAGSSHANSEEEQFEEEAKANTNSEIAPRDSCFYIQTSEWNVPTPESVVSNSLNTDGTNHYNQIEEAMLVEEDLGEDLALRTEQLASKSSSFQMQKINSSNVDSEQIHT